MTAPLVFLAFLVLGFVVLLLAMVQAPRIRRRVRAWRQRRMNRRWTVRVVRIGTITVNAVILIRLIDAGAGIFRVLLALLILSAIGAGLSVGIDELLARRDKRIDEEQAADQRTAWKRMDTGMWTGGRRG